MSIFPSPIVPLSRMIEKGQKRKIGYTSLGSRDEFARCFGGTANYWPI
jgi:hypothetical protein